MDGVGQPLWTRSEFRPAAVLKVGNAGKGGESHWSPSNLIAFIYTHVRVLMRVTLPIYNSRHPCAWLLPSAIVSTVSLYDLICVSISVPGTCCSIVRVHFFVFVETLPTVCGTSFFP